MSTITGTPLAENLASEVKEDFGRGFKSSEDRNCNVGPRVKVAEKQIQGETTNTLFFLHCRPANGFRCGTFEF